MKEGYISITFVLLASLDELINSKCFFHFEGLTKKIDSFAYSAIEWRALNYLNLNKDQSERMIEVLNALEELDDVQKIFTNAIIDN